MDDAEDTSLMTLQLDVIGAILRALLDEVGKGDEEAVVRVASGAVARLRGEMYGLEGTPESQLAMLLVYKALRIPAKNSFN